MRLLISSPHLHRDASSDGSIHAELSMTSTAAQGGLAGVLSLLEGDEFVRGILEPAGLTMDDLARPSIIQSYKKLNVPSPSDGRVPSKRHPRQGPTSFLEVYEHP